MLFAQARHDRPARVTATPECDSPESQGDAEMPHVVPLAAVAVAAVLEWGGTFDAAFVAGGELTLTGLGRAPAPLGRELDIRELGHIMAGLQDGGLTWTDAERILAA